MGDPSGIETLLELHNLILEQSGGYWIKIEAYRVKSTLQIPHGIRYSLTLHEPYGKRVLGYDNAHAVKLPQNFKYVGQQKTYDHKHRDHADKGIPYVFESAYQLMSDFFSEVDR